MSRYTPDSKERVRDAVDMIALVSGKTELRRAGVNSYFGRCPFHDERTGSFHVRPEEKHYHCFGCGESGDPFDFVMQLDGLDFRGALESLASRFGVTLEVEDEDPLARARRERRDRLHALLDRAADYYARYLWASAEAAQARAYLARRGLEERTLRTFRVGYAPSAWDKMLLGSRQAGFSEEELLATGLAQRSRQRPGSYYDRFRERIMFPLANARGRVVGFGARAMRDNQPPKYLNSSDGEVFHKSQQLFGIDLARRPAARAGTIVLAEGYTDVLALHQAGIENAVGVMGTSLTEEQARELERTARTLVLALDADGAGQEAMVRASRIAAGRRLELRVARLADGMDPADLVQQQGPGAVRELVAKSVPFVSFHVDKILAGADLGDAESKDRTLAELGPVLAAQPPSVLREELVGRIATRLGLERTLTAQLLERAAAAAPPEQPAGAAEPEPPAASPASGGSARPTASPAGAANADGGAEWHDPGPEEPWGGPSADDEDAYWASRSGDDDAYAAAADAGQVASTSAPAAVRVDPRQAKLEREFLVLCVAFPREGGDALARVDHETHLIDPVVRRAAAHMAVAGRLDALADPSPEDDAALPPADDAELRALVSQLRELAARTSAVGASLDHAEALLELARIDRAIATAKAAGTGGVTDLKRTQGAIRAHLGKLQEQIQSAG
ncbi:DNA primase [Conexibacter sp. JD483]|uniref:DNA primase n=1 Tax=unclassified Conexibacter TaxID=2627773 RepID=UPI002718E035|nr:MULTISPECIES: DNA primase [unclassified Conexibacter]MDO8185102.1 DNA primase [Conexibacter sp. CPCC 205706]MDO8196812.1 DNA primase [Conexibacter sp. CPCC 205762]MDR9368060.1 DNA primase [Conexibacter sp. JD483]